MTRLSPTETRGDHSHKPSPTLPGEFSPALTDADMDAIQRELDAMDSARMALDIAKLAPAEFDRWVLAMEHELATYAAGLKEVA